MLKDNVTFVQFYSMRVLFPFYASAHTGTVPVHYSPRVLSPFIRIMQDKVPFLHSKRVLFPFSTRTVPVFPTSILQGYCSPLSEYCRIMLHFTTVTQETVPILHKSSYRFFTYLLPTKGTCQTCIFTGLKSLSEMRQLNSKEAVELRAGRI